MRSKMNKKYFFILIGNVLFIGLFIAYLYFASKQQIWYQEIADRYYYTNVIQKDNIDSSNKFIDHLYVMNAISVMAIGEDKIDLNDFSDIPTSSHMCIGHIYLDKEKLLSSVSQREKSLVLKGLEKISIYCDE